jgi:hypothetical protein
MLPTREIAATFNRVNETERDRGMGQIEERGYFAWQNFADIRAEARGLASRRGSITIAR